MLGNGLTGADCAALPRAYSRGVIHAFVLVRTGRVFLKEMFRDLPLLWVSAEDLQHGSGTYARDDISGTHQMIPQIADLTAGFPCPDVPSLNPNAPDNEVTGG